MGTAYVIPFAPYGMAHEMTEHHVIVNNQNPVHENYPL